MYTCLFGPTIKCSPTTNSGDEPTSMAEPWVQLDINPAIVCPLLAPEVFNARPKDRSTVFNSCILQPHCAKINLSFSKFPNDGSTSSGNVLLIRFSRVVLNIQSFVKPTFVHDQLPPNALTDFFFCSASPKNC